MAAEGPEGRGGAGGGRCARTLIVILNLWPDFFKRLLHVRNADHAVDARDEDAGLRADDLAHKRDEVRHGLADEHACARQRRCAVVQPIVVSEAHAFHGTACRTCREIMEQAGSWRKVGIVNGKRRRGAARRTRREMMGQENEVAGTLNMERKSRQRRYASESPPRREMIA
ncbi:hypothetical protein C8J57DRAFT_1484359 [Mycena rebaudengoi]|nr:hypothetical protein C8J57DRAFT_1484359 [Mycena rebaudengoi]